MTTVHASERVGTIFSVEAMLAAREGSWRVLHDIAAAIRPGMTEDDARRIAAEAIAASGAQRIWHPSIVRFGPNTLKTFRQRSAPDTVLGEDDIFFVDLGLVFEGHEGDVGDTFAAGNDPIASACAMAARTIFDAVASEWRENSTTGRALYDFAARQADVAGWVLNHETKGHRVGDYPHAIWKAGDLGDFEGEPAAGLWILEIQIRHPDLPVGAFYEDLLVRGIDPAGSHA
ncbi:metallopeptidase family M24 [Luteibacter rhizovicinus]|uniref:Metallopeptidase family M24 n=1 Tax=Luteibacter rhizovicinus TaxID=242606 RepID=A0A4V2W3H9_9GAMM|nr:M24 family metallopeptidase [Luteibacter rhizovicinus]TCV92049.1 metallopeptidase family M24 [Luteibacter rhizovicinus]